MTNFMMTRLPPSPDWKRFDSEQVTPEDGHPAFNKERSGPRATAPNVRLFELLTDFGEVAQTPLYKGESTHVEKRSRNRAL